MSDYKDPRPDSSASAADPCVIYDNAVSFNEVVNGTTTVTTYTGKELLTLSQAIDKFGFGVAPFTFSVGGTIESLNLLVSNSPTDNFLYKYVGAGAAPIVVTAGADPTVGGDWQAFSATSHSLLSDLNAAGGHDAIYRRKTTVAEIESGVFIPTVEFPVILLSVSDRANAPFDVISGGTPNGTDIIDAGNGNTAVFNTVDSILIPEYFGATVGDVTKDTAALLKCFERAYNAPAEILLIRRYKHNQPLTCYYVQSHNLGFKLAGRTRDCGFEWEGAGTGLYTVDIHGRKMIVEQFSVSENSGNTNTNTGLRVCGYAVEVNEVESLGRWKRGVLGVACQFGSNFRGLRSSLDTVNTISAREGVPLQLVSCVNATVTDCFATFAQYPIVVSALGTETANNLKPPSLLEFITFGNEGIEINNYISTITRNGPIFNGIEITSTNHVYDLIHDKMITLSGSNLKVLNGWFGASSTATASTVIFDTISTGPAYVKFSGNTLAMASAGEGGAIADVFEYPFSDFSHNTIEDCVITYSGANRATCIGNEMTLGTNDVQLVNISDRNAYISSQYKSRLTEGLILGKNTPNGDGKIQIRADAGQRGLNFLTAVGTLMTTTQGGQTATATSSDNNAVLQLGNMATGRSISATGTINASGADYAEYMKKSSNCGPIKAGDIVGINASGNLTDKFSESISFCIKSTNPSYVGNDTFKAEMDFPEFVAITKPDQPIAGIIRYGQEEAAFKSNEDTKLKKYEAELLRYDSNIAEYAIKVSEYEQSYNIAREPFDRIAFCGQVPINTSSEVGCYIIPIEGVEDTITSISLKTPSFEQYMLSIGKVINTEGDKPIVIVKIS